MTDYRALLRELPAVDRLLNEPAVKKTLDQLPRRLVLQAVQETVASYRAAILDSSSDPARPGKINLSPEKMAEEAAALALRKSRPGLQPLINATGVVIHTNLGRSLLAGPAVEALAAVAASYSNLEIFLESGRRGSRQEHLEGLLCELSGAEAALVVNNNAAAVFLALNTIASGREVIVSRGQLVEIGGSFRIPEIMAAGGARLVEVGTTNKTYIHDYEAAVNENTAAVLKVHTSNYHIVGFTESVTTEDLSRLAHRNNLPLIEDLGSGVLIDTRKYGLPAEPRIQDSLAGGADVVTFSGDKMLGGPQAGVILGRRDLVAHMRKNQLARVMRIDKLTIAALEATLRLYLDEEEAVSLIPVWRMITAGPKSLRERAEQMTGRLAELFGTGNVAVVEGVSRVGGGALPEAELPAYPVAIDLQDGPVSAKELAARLRLGEPPVILRLQQDKLLIDLRTVDREREEELVQAVKKAWLA
ncbi:MAG TPA: L-seryl-tRNA(Sec) selenium transferase [Firmicutes bacterium]|nr:L-seryl-tRNA(Sec) selenium transferase [Bacillota bacterium]